MRGDPVGAAGRAYGHALFFSRGTGGSFFSGCGVLTALSGYSDGRQDRHEAGAGAAGAGRQDQHPVYHRFHGFLKDGYSVRPIQYLLKPVSREDLEQAIKTDLRLYHQPRTVTFRVAGRTFILPAEDILCAESRDHGSVLHTTHGEQFILCPLSQMQEICRRIASAAVTTASS